VHWLDTENYSHEKTMPLCYLTAPQWQSSTVIPNGHLQGEMGFDGVARYQARLLRKMFGDYQQSLCVRVSRAAATVIAQHPD